MLEVYPHIAIIKYKRKRRKVKINNIELCQDERLCTYQDDTMKSQALYLLHGTCKLGALHHRLHRDSAKISVEWFSGFKLINITINSGKAGSMALNKLPNVLWKNQSKWITLTHCIIGI